MKIGAGRDQASVLAVIVRSIAFVFALVCGLTLLATAGNDYLPMLFADRVGITPTTHLVGAITILVCVSALAVLWLRRRSLLDQWLIIVALAAILEIGLAVLFSPARFSLGFYAGRLFSLLTSTIVLVVLLEETTRLYANLHELNETLEHVSKPRRTNGCKYGMSRRTCWRSPAWTAQFSASIRLGVPPSAGLANLLGESYQCSCIRMIGKEPAANLTTSSRGIRRCTLKIGSAPRAVHIIGYRGQPRLTVDDFMAWAATLPITGERKRHCVKASEVCARQLTGSLVSLRSWLRTAGSKPSIAKSSSIVACQWKS